MKNSVFVLLAVQLLVCSQTTWVLARARHDAEQGTSSSNVDTIQEPIFRELERPNDERYEPSTSASHENTLDLGAEIELDTDNRQFVEHGAEIIAGKSAVGELPADERELYTQLLALNRAQAKMASQVEAYRTNGKFDRPAFRLGDTWQPDEPMGANINNYAPDNFNGQDVMRLFEMHREVREQLENNEATGKSDYLRATELRDLNREVREMYKKAMLGHAPAVENSPGIVAKLGKHDNVFEEEEENEEEDEECAICRESLKAEPSVRLACGHVYHESCLASWARIQSALVNTCPRCREVFRLPYRMVPKLSSEH